MLQLITIACILFGIELFYFKIADKYNIIDKPNERSSHTQITLRGGGIVFYFSVLLFFILSNASYLYFFIGLTAITAISFLDDVFTLPNKPRLIVHFLSVGLLLYQLQAFQDYLWLTPFLFVLVVGIINAYNFMDGINGITVSYSFVVLVLLAYANYLMPFVAPNLIYFTILGCLVFGFFNFRNRAKTFAGDVGSVSIAFIIVFLILKLVFVSQNPIFILFLLVYGIDTFWTIVARLLNKENIFKAHRTHLYQYLANEAKVNKLWVASAYAVLQFLIGGLVFYVSTKSIQVQWVVTVFLLISFSLGYLTFKSFLKKKYIKN